VLPLSPVVLEASKLTVHEVMELLGVETLNLDSFITIAQAAKILNVSTDTVRRHYSHLFKRLSPGRIGIKLRTLFQEIDRRTAA
jgi:hypothetical protein